ncbi:MAG: MFS transporter [Opitutaceae bacterium]|nr:MFS transporter [Opitutaceae bacterium]
MSPLRRRWLILALIFGAIVLNYVDRQILSILKPTLKREFGFDDRGYAVLVNVFTIGYATMYPVTGWLVDRFGARIVMLLGIIGWSAACIGAGLTRTLGQFTFFRGLLGLAEPTAFPAQLRVVTTWFPGTLRATANSVSVAGGTFGAVIAPPLVAWLALTFNWHAAFVVPGILGLVIAVLWVMVYRDPPAEILAQAAASTADAGSGVRFTWPQLWRTRTLWGILVIRFISDPVWYFCLFWLPGYLQENSGLTLKQIGLVGWIPFLAADIGGIASAAWSDRMVKRGMQPLRARKVMLTAVAVLAPVCVLTPHLPHPAATLAIFSVVAAVCLSWLFSLSVVIAETFPLRNAASVLGIAGGCGAAGAVVFNTFVGDMFANFGPARVFAAMAVLHPTAALLLWTMTRRERPPAA